MTRALSGLEVSQQIGQRFPEAVVEAGTEYIVVRSEDLLEVAQFLKENPELDFSYLAAITGIDRIDHFEIVYHITSIILNHNLVLKARVQGRREPSVPSLYDVWRGADLQEREVYDLMGIHFVGHPDLKRVLLWDGFSGHPLRKDYLELKGGASQ